MGGPRVLRSINGGELIQLSLVMAVATVLDHPPGAAAERLPPARRQRAPHRPRPLRRPDHVPVAAPALHRDEPRGAVARRVRRRRGLRLLHRRGRQVHLERRQLLLRARRGRDLRRLHDPLHRPRGRPAMGERHDALRRPRERALAAADRRERRDGRRDPRPRRRPARPHRPLEPARRGAARQRQQPARGRAPAPLALRRRARAPGRRVPARRAAEALRDRRRDRRGRLLPHQAPADDPGAGRRHGAGPGCGQRGLRPPAAAARRDRQLGSASPSACGG